MKITKLKLSQIKPYEGNAKLHPEEQIKQIMRSIEEFGNNDPIAVDEDYVIIEGHGRYEALKRLGYEEAECIVLKGMTEDQKNAYRLVHNKLTMNSDFDLAALYAELDKIDIDMTEFDFSYPEPAEPDYSDMDLDDTPEVDDENPPKSKLGELYRLGNHYLLCGDSTKPEDVSRLMHGARADMVFTDPPYNVDYQGVNGSRRGEIENDDFETDEEAKDKLWVPAFSNMRKFANDCCAFYVCMPQGGTHMVMMMALKEAGWQVKHELIWKKQSIVLNRADYNYQHEPICYGWNKTHKFYGKGEFHLTSVWEIDRPTSSKLHPTMKPVRLIENAILDNSDKGDVVLDLFGGSGTTLIAAEHTGRRCRMMELMPKYVDVIIKRWEQMTGKTAELVPPDESGE